MSLVKSEIKCMTIHEMGVLAEGTLEQAKKDYHLAQGANVGLVQTIKKVEALAKHVDQDLDEGKLDVTSPLEVAKHIKVYLQRAVAVLQSSAMTFEQRTLMAQGAVSAFERHVAATKKIYDNELQKIKAVQSAETEEQETPQNSNGRSSHVVGVRPGMTVKQRRMVAAQNRLTGETSPKPKKKVRRLATDASDS